jgi:23S rRNA (adenine2030-N6)-methyltransferase
MNYRHIFHAGNFADVFKHLVLILLIESLCKKEKPFFYLDTHAGSGIYDIGSETAKKSAEFVNGISRIYNLTECPEVVKQYQEIIRKLNSEKPGTLRFYPGSPYIVYSMLREHDHMVLTELHEEEYETLKNNVAAGFSLRNIYTQAKACGYNFQNKSKNIAIHHIDGYQALKAFLPPKSIGRGLILIDPPFEQNIEWNQIINGLEIALQRFPHGIYAIWYPNKDNKITSSFYSDLKQKLSYKDILRIEFEATKTAAFPDRDAAFGRTPLNSCGMIIINPPWQFKQQLDPILTWLKKHF